MITATGTHIQKIGGADGTPSAADIAIQSGRICRFGGAIWYPLLPHLVFVGLLAWKRSHSITNLLWGFLHDAHEVVTSDVPRPFKCDCMRTEQKAIDARLMFNFLQKHHRLARLALTVDIGLIKECDNDAADLEATVLGVRGYEQAQYGDKAAYNPHRQKLYDDPEDTQLLRNVLGSPFFRDDIIHGIKSSRGVTMFYTALVLAEDGQYQEFVNEVMGWDLL